MNGSTLSWAAYATIVLSIVAQPQLLKANPLSPPSGSYELTARLELPHLERWGVDKTAIICLAKYFNSALQSFDVGLGAGW